MNPGDLDTRKSGGPVMAVVGGVRSPTPPNDYLMATCVWFDDGQKQSAISVEELEPASEEPSAELAAYVAHRRAQTIAACEPPTHDNYGNPYAESVRAAMRAQAMERRLFK